MHNQDLPTTRTEPPTEEDIYVHESLVLAITEAHLKHDTARTKVLWHCYNVMYNPPINQWDLEWRRYWGYDK